MADGARERVAAWLADYEAALDDGGYAAGDSPPPPDPDDLRALIAGYQPFAAEDPMSEAEYLAAEPRYVAALAEIAEQRAKGWPDFHPEAFCHRCGQRNVKSWWTDDATWAEAKAALPDAPASDIMCPQCLSEGIEAARGEYAVWTFRIDRAT